MFFWNSLKATPRVGTNDKYGVHGDIVPRVRVFIYDFLLVIGGTFTSPLGSQATHHSD